MATHRRPRRLRNAALAVAAAGVLHFGLSLVAWAVFYVIAYRNGWHGALTITYAARHVVPAVLLLAVFLWAFVAALRVRRLAAPLVPAGVVVSLAVFAADARGEPQFQRVWFDEPNACSNRESFYCTWWWWRPTRH
jgi:hypothetical protein